MKYLKLYNEDIDTFDDFDWDEDEDENPIYDNPHNLKVGDFVMCIKSITPWGHHYLRGKKYKVSLIRHQPSNQMLNYININQYTPSLNKKVTQIFIQHTDNVTGTSTKYADPFYGIFDKYFKPINVEKK